MNEREGHAPAGLRPEGQCPHSDVHYNINLASSGDTALRYVEIRGHCKICSAPMHFLGRMGMLPTEPAVEPGGEEVRLPMLFGDEKPTGKEVGFTIKQVDVQ